MHKRQSPLPSGSLDWRSFLVQKLVPVLDSGTARELVLWLARALGSAWSLAQASARLRVNTGCTIGSRSDMWSLARNTWTQTNPVPHTDPRNPHKDYLVSLWAQEQEHPGEWNLSHQ